MKTRAAVLHAVGEQWSVEEIELDPPGPGEVLVKTAYAGLCHSDEHVVTGDLVPPQELLDLLGVDTIFPIIGGHEGAGVVVEVGPNVTKVAPGDHVSCAFVPACGICPPCAEGKQNLCDLGARTFGGGMITDGTFRTHAADGTDLNTLAKLGTFAEHMVLADASVIKVEPDLPLEVVCLVSCGVATGYGSAVNRAEVRAGATVVVVGCGGIGSNAVQGAAAAGAANIIAVDPVQFKQEKAMEFGATHAVGSMDEAMPLVTDLTWGRMADATILTPGVLYGELIQPAMALTAKGGTVVATAVAPMSQEDVKLDLAMLTLNQKELRGTIFGSASPNSSIPELLMLYRQGKLKLDELITQKYSLDEINQGYKDMNDGKNIRGVIAFD
ncbi:MAG: NDMA-dependent alcohol dehydrogenase [Acidimicrobiia bacterium]|nr:NDMA-dependent alcohol dehydrogenase [Acidimicrobiia bacterium]